MKKRLLATLFATTLLIACSGDGLDGNDGNDGTAGQDGTQGIQGIPGLDAGNLTVIGLEANDMDGTDMDTTITAHFAGKVDGLTDYLQNATMTFSYGKRKGAQVVCSYYEYCNYNENGDMYLYDYYGDTSDGFIDRYDWLFIEFDRLIMSDPNTQSITKWLNDAVGVENAFIGMPDYAGDYEPYEDNYGFWFQAQKRIPITNFDADGNNIGLELFMPAFTVVDHAGNGNVGTKILLWEPLTTESQAEPEAVEFDAYTHHQAIDAGFIENYEFANNDTFYLEFTLPMDEQSTIEAIEYRLIEAGGPFAVIDEPTDIIVQMEDAYTFSVYLADLEIGESVDFSANGTVTFTLQPWDVMTQDGITNSNNAISWTLSDITVPVLTNQLPEMIVPIGPSFQLTFDYVGVDMDDTLAIILAFDVDRTDNNELVAGDTILFSFDIPEGGGLYEDPADDYEQAIMDVLNNNVMTTGTVTAGQLDFSANPTVSLTLTGTQTISIVGSALSLGNLDVNRLMDTAESGNDGRISIASNQNPTASKTNWYQAATLYDAKTDIGADDNSLFVYPTGGNDLEDYTLEAGDTVQIRVNKYMEVGSASTIAHEFARLLSTASISGGTRTGTWNVATVAASILSNENIDQFGPNEGHHSNLLYHYFSYTLTGDQTLEATGSRMSFGNIDETAPVKDLHGLFMASNQEVVVERSEFDAPVTPYLESIVGSRPAYAPFSPCGNNVAEEYDTITFTFSEQLSTANPDSVQDVQDAILAALNVQLTNSGSTTPLTAGDIIVNNNRVFIVTLGEDQFFNIGSAIPFTFTASDVVDQWGIQATSVSGTLEPFDNLTMELYFDQMDWEYNLVPYDGQLVAHDEFYLYFPQCTMARYHTVSAIQEAVDTLMGDGTAKVEANNYNDTRNFMVQILPGQSFDVSVARMLSVSNVATALDDEHLDEDGEKTVIAGPFNVAIADVMIEDVTVTYVPDSANGFEASFVAPESMFTGIWYLSDVDGGISRISEEMPIVFGGPQMSYMPE